MLCKVTTPANPGGSSWGRPCASCWSKMETKRLNSSSSKQDHEKIIIVLQMVPTTKSPRSCFHVEHNMVHKPNSIPEAVEAVNIPAGRVAMDRDWNTSRMEQLLVCGMLMIATISLVGRTLPQLRTSQFTLDSSVRVTSNILHSPHISAPFF